MEEEKYKCPECRSKNIEMTCIGGIVGPDPNRAKCCDCGWVGSAELCRQPKIFNSNEYRDEMIKNGLGTVVCVYRGNWCGHIIMYEADLKKQPTTEALEKLWLAKIRNCINSFDEVEKDPELQKELKGGDNA